LVHAHDHSHDHAPRSFGKAFAVGIALNLIIVGLQIVFGLRAGSLALLADAAHNFSDVIGLALAWIAAWLSTKRATRRFTYGFRRASILAALANAALLLLATGGIVLEAVQRFFHPAPVVGEIVIGVALAGIVVNFATALLFRRGGQDDLNIRAAFLHLMGDAAISFGVVIAAALVLYTGWFWLDPAVSIVIAVLIVAGTWSLARNSISLAMDAVPQGIDPNEVRNFLTNLPGVTAVHDLHIWAMSTTETALTAHIVLPAAKGGDEFLSRTARGLEHRFGIRHTTLQIETGTGEAACKAACADCPS